MILRHTLLLLVGPHTSEPKHTSHDWKHEGELITGSLAEDHPAHAET
jgi:hypothetical protein